MTSVTRFPTTNNTGTWANPNNAHADDGVDTTGTSPNDTLWGTFGFDGVIPAGATINSVTVTIEDGLAEATDLINSQPRVGGVDQTSRRIATGPQTYPHVDTVDHTADRSWTRADLLNGTFEVRLAYSSLNSNLASVDYVKVTVDYTSGPTVDTTTQWLQIPNKNVGPQVLRYQFTKPIVIDMQTVAAAKDTEFGIRFRARRNGPTVRRGVYAIHPTFPMVQPAAITDTEFGTRIVPPNCNVGPAALRVKLRRPEIYWTVAATGATLSLVTLTVTATGTALFQKMPIKLFTVTSTGTPTILKQAQKLFQVTATATPAIVRTPWKLFAVISTGTVTLLKTPWKLLSVTATGSPVLQKMVARLLTVTSTSSPVVLKTPIKVLAVTATGTPAFVRSAWKNLAVTATGTPTFIKSVARTLAVTATGTPGVFKRYPVTLFVTATGTAALSALKTVTAAAINLGRTRNRIGRKGSELK